MNENQSIDKKKLMEKLSAARTSLLLKAPFYGTLLMNLKFGLAPCGTACTDMRRILWDPKFLDRLSVEEVKFVLLHEVLHCVLEHISRGKGTISYLYNVAADIVVNSLIMESYGVKEFYIDGESAMHLAPDGNEGRCYNADQVYEMLLKKYESLVDDIDNLVKELSEEYGEIDSHDIWKKVPLSPELSEEWKARIREAAKRSGSVNGMPATIRKILEMSDHNPAINWHQVLREFIQLVVDSYDFTFTPSDRRFSDGDFILPSFHEIEGEAIENLWMLIDTSGSIDDKLLSDVFCEIKLSLEQFSSVKAKISCFDTKVTEPLECANVEDLKKVKIKGGGGTSFQCIFDYLINHMNDDMPVAIVIMTDGYASFPDESSSCGIPVLWVLINNDQDAPWGKSIHVQL